MDDESCESTDEDDVTGLGTSEGDSQRQRDCDEVDRVKQDAV